MKRWRSLLVAVIVALTLVGAHRALLESAAARSSPAGEAEWIWARTSGVAGSPAAFFAVRDFELDFEPTHAELRILADEEYQLTLNGYTIAMGGYPVAAGGGAAEMASYAVHNLLKRVNRLVIELRSARGAGGLLLALTVTGSDGEEMTVVSDGSWRVARRFSAGLRRPGGVFAGEEPLVWGAQPSGRWGVPSGAAEMLTLRQLQGGRRLRTLTAERKGRHGGAWVPVREGAARPLGPWARIDFKRERTGYLRLRFANRKPSRGFVYYDLRRPPQGLAGPGETVIRVGGRDGWTASRPATFRFVTLVGLPKVVAAEIIPVAPERAAPLLERAERSGLFGIARERSLMSPVEDEVRGKLEGIPGLARRKEG